MARSSDAAPRATTRRPPWRAWWALAALALVVGYADLWRGGITLGPMALVVGHVVLLPVAILRG